MTDPTLKFIPYPTLQMYSTYTVGLDSLAAEFYCGLQAPTFIVLNLKDCTIDGKHLFLECPRTWMAIKENYEFVDSDERYVLLRKRPTRVAVARNRRLEVPHLSWSGKLLSLVFRGKIYRTELRCSAGGKHWTGRINPLVLQSPIDDGLVVHPSDYATYFQD